TTISSRYAASGSASSDPDSYPKMSRISVRVPTSVGVTRHCQRLIVRPESFCRSTVCVSISNPIPVSCAETVSESSTSRSTTSPGNPCSASLPASASSVALITSDTSIALLNASFAGGRLYVTFRDLNCDCSPEAAAAATEAVAGSAWAVTGASTAAGAPTAAGASMIAATGGGGGGGGGGADSASLAGGGEAARGAGAPRRSASAGAGDAV